MKDTFRGRTQRTKERFELRTHDRVMPELELRGYTCEYCEDFKAPPSYPYFRALAQHGEHNKQHHPKQYPAPKVMMVYKI